MESFSKFDYRRTRQFGEVMEDGFKLLKPHIRVLLRAFLLYVLPFTILGGYCYGKFMGTMMVDVMNMPENFDGTQVLMMLLGIFSLMVGSLVAYSVMFAVVVKDINGEEVEADNVGSIVFTYFFKILGINLTMIALIVIPALFVIMLSLVSPVLVGLLMFVGFFVMMYFAVIFYLVPFIAVYEDKGFFDGYSRAKRLIQGEWWMTFLLIIIVGIIGAIVSYIFSAPAQIVAVFTETSFEPGAAGVSSTTMIVSQILQMVGSSLVSFYVLACIIIWYFHLVEKKEGNSLQNEISAFGESNDNSFENDGEF